MERRPASDRVPAPRDWWWIFDPRYSLCARASLIAGTSAVLFTLLLGWIASSLVRRSLERHYRSTFETLAVQVTDKIDRRIFERYRTLQLAANLPSIRSTQTSPEVRRRVFTAMQESAAEFAWIGFVDPSGRVTVGTEGLFENSDVSERPWFRGARERPFVGPVNDRPELARTLKNPDDIELPGRFFDLAVPVVDTKGDFAGVLAAHVRWGWAREAQLSVVTEAALREKIGVTIYAGPNDVLLDTGTSGWTHPPEAPALPEARRFRGAIIEHATGGSTYLTGYARSHGYREFKGLGWLTTVRQPLERLFAPVTELHHAVLGWGFVFTAFAMVASWGLAARFSRQFRRIGSAAERIHEGDILSVLPRPKDGGELSRMCDALDTLVEDLRAKERALMAENARLKGHASETQKR